MEIFLFISAALLIVLSAVGAVVPGLPGPPLGYLGLLLLHFTDKVQYSATFLIVWAVIVLLVTVGENFLPVMTARLAGGSKYAVRGSIVGLIVGIIFTPIGMILGTLLGAIIGELIGGADCYVALKSGLATFAGTMLGIGVKLIISVIFAYYFIAALF